MNTKFENKTEDDYGNCNSCEVAYCIKSLCGVIPYVDHLLLQVWSGLK